MSDIKKTTKNEMSYDIDSGQAIFNDRNITAKMPQHRPFPARLVSIHTSSSVEGSTLEVAETDTIEEHTLTINSGNIVGHTLEM